MPFTLAHPALIIPLLHVQRRYQWISATGLITGSIAPDFEKFFRLQLASRYSHTVASIFYFSCPISLGLAFIFHLLVRRPLLAHLPAPLYKRLGRYGPFDWPGYFRQHYWGVLLSIIVGAALHLVWDSFTHYNELVTSLLPGVDYSVLIGPLTVPIYELVGLLSSVVGGLIVGWSVWKMPVGSPRSVPTTAAVGRYWGLVGLVTLALAGEWILAVKPRLLSAGIAAISATLLGIVFVSAYTNYRRLTQGRPLRR